MGKRTRIVLYALSLVTMLAMVTLIIFSRGRQQEKPTEDAMAQTDVVSTEEQIQTPEDHTDTTEGQKNLNNGTGQEETNETETRATEETESEPGQADDTTGDGSTTLIFAGDVLFANAFKSNYDAGGIEKVIEPQLLQELQDAYIFMVNNEFPTRNLRAADVQSQRNGDASRTRTDVQDADGVFFLLSFLLVSSFLSFLEFLF